MKVFTIKGLIDYAELDVKPVMEVGDNYCKVAIEYRHQGELVKRSVHIDMLRPLESQAVEGQLG